MKIFDPNGELGIIRAGQVTLIARPGAQISDAQPIPGTLAVLLGGDDLKADFARWLDSMEVEAAAKQLGVSRALAGRMRVGLGLSEPYKGESRTTAWRRRKQQAE